MSKVKCVLFTKPVNDCFYCPNHNYFTSYCKKLERYIDKVKGSFQDFYPVPADCPLPVCDTMGNIKEPKKNGDVQIEIVRASMELDLHAIHMSKLIESKKTTEEQND